MSACPGRYDFNEANSIPNVSGIERLEANARRNCNYCSLVVKIVKCVSKYYRKNLDFVDWNCIISSTLRFSTWSGNNPADSFDVSVVLKDEFVEPAVEPGSIDINELVERDTSSEQSLWKAKEWLKNCTTQHRRCGNRKPTYLPSRVIDVESKAPDVAVVENGTPSHYLALSHCWGNEKMMGTNEKNISEHKKRIHVDSLPRTFQHAVMFARKLSIQYLWIDSLCIIQDNEKDWEAESAKMADVYQNALLTIAATGSKNASGGCFTKFVHLEMKGIHVDGRPYTALCTREVFHWGPTRNVREENIFFPLLSRGWVYQERLLSPRMLHFGQQELIWECMEQSDCQCEALRKVDRPFSKMGFTMDEDHQLTDKQRGQIWRRKVNDYSKLSLTFSSDRFPAMAGLARQESLRRKEATYLAGLWSDTLICDLMWFTSTKKVLTSHQRAPSWSWAAIEGTVFYFDIPEIGLKKGGEFIEARCHIVNTTCRSKNDQSFLGPYTGEVTLFSRIRPVSVLDNGLSEPTLTCKVNGRDIYINHMFFLPPGNHYVLDAEAEVDALSNEPAGVVLVELAIIKADWEWAEDMIPSRSRQQYAISLLLKQESLNEGVLKRIGLLAWDVDECDLFEEQNKHTITII